MWILVVLILITTFNVYAANPYKLGHVIYFYDKTSSNSKDNLSKEFDWREPLISPNGKVSNYTPPQVMVTLLDNPTPENAKAYLAWQRLKVLKIIKAQEMIEQVLKEDVQ